MRGLFYSIFGVALMISGFVMIASLSSSLGPRAQSQTEGEVAPPPADWQPDPGVVPGADEPSAPQPTLEIPDLSIPEASQGMDATGAGGEGDPSAIPLPGQLPTDQISGEQLPLRQDPFIPVMTPAKAPPKVQVSTPGEPPPEEATPGEEFFDPKDPYRMHFLRDYKLSGVLWDNLTPKAMFKTPEGKTLTLRRKSMLGREGAVVITVRESEVLFLIPGPGKNYENGTVKILSLRK